MVHVNDREQERGRGKEGMTRDRKGVEEREKGGLHERGNVEWETGNDRRCEEGQETGERTEIRKGKRGIRKGEWQAMGGGRWRRGKEGVRKKKKRE